MQAQYWFKHGKGEDPAKVTLDSDMDSYWAQKKAEPEAAEPEAAEPAAVVENAE